VSQLSSYHVRVLGVDVSPAATDTTVAIPISPYALADCSSMTDGPAEVYLARHKTLDFTVLEHHIRPYQAQVRSSIIIRCMRFSGRLGLYKCRVSSIYLVATALIMCNYV
jgi:hypothetical protein